MIDPAQVAAVIPTRGDVDLDEITDALWGYACGELRVWDNGAGECQTLGPEFAIGLPDLGVYGRYAAIEYTKSPVIITQDDDVILPAETIQALLDAYEPGKVVCNIPARFRTRYRDSGMVGFGAIFDRDLPARAFDRFLGPRDGRSENIWAEAPDLDGPACMTLFERTCDLVFTMLTPMIQVDLPYVELAYGKDETRMWRQPGHFDERDRMRKLCREVRDG